jgi:hypothetical protein
MKSSYQNSISFRRLITETYKDVLVQVNGSMGPVLPRGLYINAFIFSYFKECREKRYHASDSCKVVILTGLCANSSLHERPLERDLGIWNIFKLSALHSTARYATGHYGVK